MKQKTLKNSFSVSGKGLHTGLNITATFLPAPENHGYKIQRVDLEGQPVIEALAENVVETSRGTVIADGDVRISTIEHAMAALYAAEIDNCLIQVNAPEMPILDGSAAVYAEEIERCGLEEQNAEREYYLIKSKIEIHDEETGSSIVVLPDDELVQHAHLIRLSYLEQSIRQSRRSARFQKRNCRGSHIRFRTRSRTAGKK